MDPPATLDAEDVRDRIAEALRACKLWGDDPVSAGRQARYSAGTIAGRELSGYAHESGVDPSRHTETLAELKLQVDTPRWAGVPFRLRSGKALGDRRKEIVVTFKGVLRRIPGLSGHELPTRLRFSLGPDRLALDVNINGPADPFEIDRVELSAEFAPGRLFGLRRGPGSCPSVRPAAVDARGYRRAVLADRRSSTCGVAGGPRTARGISGRIRRAGRVGCNLTGLPGRPGMDQLDRSCWCRSALSFA